MGFDYVTQDAGGRAIMDQAQTSILYHELGAYPDALGVRQRWRWSHDYRLSP